jgi:hypothetical protein
VSCLLVAGGVVISLEIDLPAMDEIQSFLYEAGGVVYIHLSNFAMSRMGRVTEFDPLFAINFNEDHLVTGLAAVYDMPIPDWMPNAVHPISAEAFKAFVMNCCSQVIDSFMIAPNSAAEFSRIVQRVASLCKDPFVLAVANGAQGSLGKVYLVQESSRNMVATPQEVDHLQLPAGAIAAFD